jgi:hypothetical protein
MARKTVVSLVDDLDGGQAEETVAFALDGVTYEIDLSAANSDQLRTSLATFVGSARRTGGRTRPSGSTAAGRSSPQRTQKIREWARANGYTVSDRGRISADIVTAYNKAH